MKYNLHDATLDSIELKILESTTLFLTVSLYPNEHERVRARGTVKISNVASISSTIDFKRQARHRTFGNVSDWNPASRRGLTFLYLAGGTIAVFGDVPEVELTDVKNV